MMPAQSSALLRTGLTRSIVPPVIFKPRTIKFVRCKKQSTPKHVFTNQ
jgi:hypothetical protein